MSKERDIERSYRLLIEQGEKWRKLNSISYAIFYFGFNVMLYGTFEGGHIYEAGYYIPTIVGIAIVFVGIRFQNKAKQLTLNSHEKLFLRFYRTADILENYLGQKKSRNKKIPTTRLKNLSRHISFWVSKKTPPTFRNAPQSISDYLRSSISLIKENDDEKIRLLIKSLYTIAKSSYEKDPSYSDFEEFKNSLKNLVPESSETSNYLAFLQKYSDVIKSDPRSKFIIVGIGSVIALIGTQTILPPDISQQITTVIFGIIAIATLLLYLYDRSNKTNPKNKSDSSN